MKNENKQEDMISILEHLTKYVPFVTTEDAVFDEKSNTMVPLIDHHIHDLLLGGDQLTVERVRGAQRTRDNANKKLESLQSFKGVVEDWHSGVALMKVSLYFYCIWMYACTV